MLPHNVTVTKITRTEATKPRKKERKKEREKERKKR